MVEWSARDATSDRIGAMQAPAVARVAPSVPPDLDPNWSRPVNTSLRRSLLAALPVLLIALVALGASPAPTAPEAAPVPVSPAAAKTLGIDGSHSFVMFKVRHNGVNDAWGRFNQISGRILLDDENPGDSSVSIEIPADSVDTGNEKRDGHLKSPDFFNAVEFPTISFESESVKSTGKDTFEVKGRMSLHGETKPLTVTVTRAVAEGRRGAVYGFASTFTFKRSDYGMDYGIEQGSLGDEITVMLNLEAGER
jgi:polyisoprenoid-binding protein YceI